MAYAELARVSRRPKKQKISRKSPNEIVCLQFIGSSDDKFSEFSWFAIELYTKKAINIFYAEIVNAVKNIKTFG